MVRYHRYPKFKVALEPDDIELSEFNGLNSTDVTQYPFFLFVKLDCMKRLNGNGLIPKTNLVLLNFLPTPNLPVTIVGNAKPASYSKIILFSLI